MLSLSQVQCRLISHGADPRLFSQHLIQKIVSLSEEMLLPVVINKPLGIIV